MSEEKLHATFGASSAYRWLNCPGSIELSKTAPEQPESAYAIEGTKGHECLEFLLTAITEGHDFSQAEFLALKSYDTDMVTYGAHAARWIYDQIDQDPGELLCETKVDATPFTCEGQFGTLDAAIVRDFGRLTVIDYKYGAGISVDAQIEGDCNPQLAYYALGISHQFHHNFSEVELVVIQPRAYHESGETIRSAIFSMDHLLKWGEKFKAGVEAALDPLAPLNAGGWCKFCPATLTCPEIRENAIKRAAIDFDEADRLVPVVDKLSPEAVGRALNEADKLETFIDAFRKHAAHLLERGVSIPGWKLVQKRSVRKWADPEATADKALAILEYEDVYTEPELLSPTQLEKNLIIKEGKDWAKKWIATQVVSESSGTTLAPASDKRPEVRPFDLFID